MIGEALKNVGVIMLTLFFMLILFTLIAIVAYLIFAPKIQAVIPI